MIAFKSNVSPKVNKIDVKKVLLCIYFEINSRSVVPDFTSNNSHVLRIMTLNSKPYSEILKVGDSGITERRKAIKSGVLIYIMQVIAMTRYVFRNTAFRTGIYRLRESYCCTNYPCDYNF
jgi:hypothetical protein